MGATYTRQSSAGITDGAVIEASDINDEFDQLLAAFVAASGHTHDGTAAEGGPVAKLLGTSLTLGDGTAGTDITVTFDGETSDGVLYWMEDEDHFKFAVPSTSISPARSIPAAPANTRSSADVSHSI